MPSCSQMTLHFKTWTTLQELTSIVWSWDAGVNAISGKIETYRVTKVKICLIKYEDYEGIYFFLPPDVGVAVLVCLRALIVVIKLKKIKIKINSTSFIKRSSKVKPGQFNEETTSALFFSIAECTCKERLKKWI